MSFLNADVEDGLNSDIDPSALIQAPVDTSTKAPELVFVSTMNSTSTQPNTDNVNIIDEVPDAGQLPNIDAKFAIVDQQHVTVTDLKSVENMIMTQNVISREDADVIESVFGNFFGARLAREEFTPHKTKTNLPFAQRFMKTAIAKEEVELFDKFKVFFHEPMEDFCQFMHHYEHYYIPFIKDQVLGLRLSHKSVLSEIAESKNVVIPWGEDQSLLINVLTLELHNELVTGAVGEQAFGDALNNVKDILSNSEFVGFIKAVLSNGMTSPEWDELAARHTYYENDLTLGQLIQFYNSDRLADALESLLIKIKTTITSFAALNEVSKTVSSDFNEIEKFLLASTKQVKSINDVMQTLFGIAKNMSLLNVSMNVILAYLKRCL